MKAKAAIGLTLILLLASTLIMMFNPGSVQASQDTRLYIDPASISDLTLTPGHNFTVDIMVSDVEFLYAWQANLSFNPDVLKFVDVTEGDFLASQPEGTFGGLRIEESWALFGWSTLGSYVGVSGSGTLATVIFEVETEGKSPIRFELDRTFLVGQDNPGYPNFYDIEFIVDNGHFNNMPIAVYTDQYTYREGDTMYLGLDINNPLAYPINVCVAVWLERPTGPIVILLHAHAVTLPGGFSYSNPSFDSFVLPPIPPGVYTWHAALLNPSPHAILIEDTAEWEFV